MPNPGFDQVAPIPTAEEVDRFHTFADTDTRAEAIHHTLGQGPNQAARGDDPRFSALSANLKRGTTSERTAVTPKYWDMWWDTTLSQMFVGSLTGTWRRFSGSLTNAAAAWDSTFTGPPALAGRTIVFTVPTVLAAHENLLVTPLGVGSGFGFISVASIVRNASDTTLSVRFMQILSVATQALTIAWEIVPV